MMDFKSYSGRVRLADMNILDVAGVGDVVLKTHPGMNWVLKCEVYSYA